MASRFPDSRLLPSRLFTRHYLWAGTDETAQAFSKTLTVEDIIELIFMSCTASLTEFLRRFQSYGVSGDEAVFWLLIQLGQELQAAELLQRLRSAMARVSPDAVPEFIEDGSCFLIRYCHYQD